MTRIGLIGGGKMAEALISRLGAPHKIIASDISRQRLNYLRKKYKIKITTDNLDVFSSAEVVILAVKPQNMAGVLMGLRNAERVTSKRKIIISIAAGVPINYLQKNLPGCQIIRTMPNNPSLVGAGMTAIAKGKSVTRYALRVTKRIFETVGEVIEVPERLMDAVTGLSGSGPAYVYLMIEALASAGEKLGIAKKEAEKLAVQTVLGAAKTMRETGKTAKELIAMVTSPGGTTIEGLKVLEKRKFSEAIVSAVKAAAEKSKKLK
ncbi:MAG: pyrroline-5-carboxylate reductase [Candidatus Margulisiibacteriota bacterium]